MLAFKKYSLLLLFSALLLATSVADMFVNGRQFSEMENRYLTQRPKFTFSQLFRNEYTPKYEAYINDQFVARDAWITLKSVSETALGKIENNGIIYGGEHHMFEDYRSTDERRLKQNINFINAYFEKYQGQSNFTAAIIPSSYAVLDNLVPQGLQNVDQNKRIQELYSLIPNSVTVWNLFPVMKGAVQKAEAAEMQDPVYYRTDHHWTTFGAYNAYQSFVQSRGLKAVDWDNLRPLEHQVPDFYGSYYSKCKLYSAVPDTITYFDIPFESVMIDEEEKPSLYDSSLWGKRDKHAAFLWGNNGVTVIKSLNNLNAQEGKTTSILLIKDSYGNSFAPFLTYSYDEVYVIDLRSMKGKMSDFMAAHSFDDVLLMYSFMNFASDTNISLLTE